MTDGNNGRTIAAAIYDHHDGHGLAEKLTIHHDGRDKWAGGASHYYEVRHHDVAYGPVAVVQFQHGPRADTGSQHGCLDSVLLAVVLDRLRCFQAGPFPSRQNAIAITKIEEALFWMRNRADERARRGVLGRNER